MSNSDKAAADAILAKYRDLKQQRKGNIAAMLVLQQRGRQLAQELLDCEAAARLFGVRLPDDAADDNLADVQAAPLGSLDEALDRIARAPAAEPGPKIKDIVLDRLKAAGAAGTKASEIREFIDVKYGTPIHEKTVGMSLFRLSRKGLAHRRGITWIYGPDPSGTENPGGDTPGLIDKLFS